ncbi:MAG: hypothetical protein HKN70_01920 [Gammaproteobacteria bacterium]|nr:hypothetical protein [Gammaproteobacteria bacterium]
MPQPRNQLVCAEITPYYHISTRCVRRAFLCGQDQQTGRCFEHRRQWIEDRIRLLSSVFAIDVCAYAVMSNHYHLVVRLNPEQTGKWSNFEVLRRWRTLFKGPLLIQKYARDEALSPAEWETVQSTLAVYSQRLGNLSWFMKCLNESIARQANAEDEVTGHFWEARFASQALCTDDALLTCMAYVDLNPVRAGIAATPEQSRYTSLYERLNRRWPLGRSMCDVAKDQGLRGFDLAIKPLLGFGDRNSPSKNNDTNTNNLPISFTDYAELVDWSGRALRAGKRGAIAVHVAPVLERLNLSEDQWFNATRGFEVLHRRKAAVVIAGK